MTITHDLRGRLGKASVMLFFFFLTFNLASAIKEGKCNVFIFLKSSFSPGFSSLSISTLLRMEQSVGLIDRSGWSSWSTESWLGVTVEGVDIDHLDFNEAGVVGSSRDGIGVWLSTLVTDGMMELLKVMGKCWL